MVKALMGKIDSKLLRSWEFFIMVIALVFALIPAIRGEMAWVYFLPSFAFGSSLCLSRAC